MRSKESYVEPNTKNSYHIHAYTKVFFPLGGLGMKTFALYGWRSDAMYPFMYNRLYIAVNPHQIK